MALSDDDVEVVDGEGEVEGDELPDESDVDVEEDEVESDELDVDESELAAVFDDDEPLRLSVL